MVGSAESKDPGDARRDAPARRIEDRISHLCDEISFTQDLQRFVMLRAEIEAAMAEFIRRIEDRASAAVIGWPEFPHERRKTRNISG